MAWNIGVMCIKAKYDEISNIIPDIFYKVEKNVFFEDATSIMMGEALAVTHSNSWIIIIDTLGRFIFNDEFPKKLSRHYKVKTFWISEEPIFRDYRYGILRKGGIGAEYIGINQGVKYLNEYKLRKIDKYGETIAMQMIEKEIFNKELKEGELSLFPLKYLKFEMD
ncbi:hypothetical protein [Oceanirhabdus sp. W0125-5]|uniref:hypothetical protein n=1 Tax=Oceanirhabdus sp. W0125-5 TaxID=2999116 RepID=UPI0022F32F06|nr:hypothetical protein [Oceanirhabdus sp. W0125-5]WBW95182.1 hypothetical protein OW730_15975 [Oceanirhabdus sp. W0125-5]